MRSILSILLLSLSLQSISQARYIHVLVALCDNKNQGIVPVPEKIGNGQDPANNLYWGCGFGVKTFLKKQPDWTLLKQINNPSSSIYERLVFKHKDSLVFLIADAYDGSKIKQTITDCLNYASGNDNYLLKLDSIYIRASGNANLICYVGHNGLMDFSLESYPGKADNSMREIVLLACASKSYFIGPVKKSGASPLVWTTHLMCPEAYTLDAIIDSWILHDSATLTREKAAQAYNQYQKCGIKGARKLFVTGY